MRQSERKAKIQALEGFGLVLDVVKDLQDQIDELKNRIKKLEK